MILVNQSHPLPEDWEKSLQTVTVVNSVGDEVVVEKKTYDAYLLLTQTSHIENNRCTLKIL
jgi:D-alanyl-D-alanine carboxypeptidase